MTAPNPTLASIGIFDSGFGGLTVMRAIRELMPHENIVYFGDTARVPYGDKSPETILQYSLENSSFLAKQGIKVLIIACNTSCSAALEQMRKQIDIPIVAITEQGVDEVTRLFPEEKVGLLATRATISSNVYQQQILARCPAIDLFPVACPRFVPLVEQGLIEHPECKIAIQEYLQELKDKRIKGLLLGCSHYPLLQAAIQRELGSEVQLIDPAASCAQKTRQLLEEFNLLTPSTASPQYKFFVSDDPEKFRLHGKHFLNYPIDHVSLATNEK